MLVALLVLLALAEGGGEWMTDDGNRLELMVAKLEDGNLCGGFLRVDRAAHSLVFASAPGAIGCKKTAEATATDVKSVKTGDGAGFLVELASGKEKKLLLIPLPHAAWLKAQPLVKNYGGLQQQMQMVGARGPDGQPVQLNGDAGGAGPNMKDVKIPEDVTADTKRAASAVLAALGR